MRALQLHGPLMERPTTLRPCYGPTSLATSLAPRLPGNLMAGVPTLWRAALRRRRSVAWLGAAVPMFIAAGMLGLPVIAGTFMALGTLAYAGLVARDLLSPDFASRVYGPLGPPLRPQVPPEDVRPEELRAAYLGVLVAHEEIRAALGETPSIAGTLDDVYRRCGEMVQAIGRIARNGNLLHEYLVAVSPDLMEVALRLEVLGARTSDEAANRAFEHAAASSRQHVHLHRQLQGLYDRMKARIAAVAAFLGVVRALVVKLQVLELEQLGAAASDVTSSVDELRGELELLETSLEAALV